MTKNELLVCLNTRFKSLSKKYDVTKQDEYNSYINGYTKGIEEAIAMVKTLNEDKQ
jgi:hypothetical protein